MNYTCSVCQNEEHSDDANFCMRCGAKIEKESEEEHSRRIKESIRKFVNGEISSKQHLKTLYGKKAFEFEESVAVRL
jgi:DNA-directed RNA polymerase subunit RPC12/RpoP